MIVVAACSLAGVGEAASQTKHLAGVVRDETPFPEYPSKYWIHGNTS